jgi:hypothetical protein
MPRALDPFRFLLIAVAGWMNQHQLLAIDYLREENRILREQLGGRRLRFTDDQRRRLATKAKGLGRRFRCGNRHDRHPRDALAGIAN